MFKLGKDSEKLNKQKKTKAKVAAWGVAASGSTQHGAGSTATGSDIIGRAWISQNFVIGSWDHLQCTHQAEALLIPYWQLCHKASLEQCSAPGSSFCRGCPEAGISLRLQAGPPPHHIPSSPPASHYLDVNVETAKQEHVSSRFSLGLSYLMISSWESC